MRQVGFALLTIGLTACGPVEPELGVVRLRSGVWEDEEILEFHHRVVYSQCVLDELAKYSEEELEAWRQAFCDRDVYPSGVNCSSMEIESNEAAYVFKYFDPQDRSKDTDFILGPIPTPENMDCDSYIELAGVYWRTPTTANAIGSSPWAELPKARADGKRY